MMMTQRLRCPELAVQFERRTEAAPSNSIAATRGRAAAGLSLFKAPAGRSSSGLPQWGRQNVKYDVFRVRLQACECALFMKRLELVVP